MPEQKTINNEISQAVPTTAAPVKEVKSVNQPKRYGALRPRTKAAFVKNIGNERRALPLIMAGVLLLGAVGAAAYFYNRYSDLKKNPQEFAQKEVKDVVAAVGKLIVLPEGEEPTVATVSDVEKLKDQPFFAHAKQGDKVIIYTQARKAILYDPQANKIVEVAPLNVGNN